MANDQKKWGAGFRPQPLTVPSGEQCLAKKPDLPTLLKNGLIDALDSLGPIVQDEIEGKQTNDEDFIKNLSANPETMTKFFETLDKIVMLTVLQPRLRPVPPPEAERDEDAIYVDEIGFEDKMFIFTWGMEGIGDLQTFRAGQGEGVGGVEPQQGVGVQTVAGTRLQ